MHKDKIEHIRAQCRNGKNSLVDVRGELEDIFSFALEHADERPKLKPVDLSVLLISGIDCEFKTPQDDWRVGKLLKIYSNSVYDQMCSSNIGIECIYCRPRINHVHAWSGGKCPLPAGIQIRFQLRRRSVRSH